MFNNDWKFSINSKTFESLDTSLFINYKFTTLMSFFFFVLILTILKAALFISDVYTCVKLLAFNSWSNDLIQPYIPFRISKWLFSGCILASIALMIWEVVNGIRIYRTRNISLTYVNNFSRAIYSLTQYDKFCVFNKVTPKGTYQRIAFFTFFELKDCIRLLFADTPRQVINGLTLWSVIVTVDNGANLGNVENFQGLISKIKTIANTNREEAVLLSFMLFSFIIWAFFISKLLIACICSVFVYYRLIHDRKMSGLKEFVCTTVSDKVDQLVDKYEKRKQFTRAYQNGPSTSSSLQLDDLEPARWAVKNYSQPSLNTSTADLLQKNSDTTSRGASPAPKLNLLTSVESLPDYESDPIVATSPIVNLQGGFPRREVKFNSFTNVHTFDSAVSNNQPSFARLNNNDSFNSVGTSNTVPSYYFATGKSENNLRRNVLDQQPSKNFHDNINRGESDNFAINDGVDDSTPQSKAYCSPPPSTSNSHVYTPDRAYFGESAFQRDRTAQDSLPQRSTSLLNRRDRIENEDYEYYAQRGIY
ncbi:LAFE_0C11320g1_1 [Lachancea fermentati]|uniref:LAFE_0C11320g1_1 n=1 Tax=Lachancea fermentati TaxID=4955 RepID=A0A1G4MAE2_LACFM|nr:LAFE_0C11320g1_1 [Lachancea fermentati]